MDYNRLTNANRLGDTIIDDGYNGAKLKVSLHWIDDTLWIKTVCGCFRAPRDLADYKILNEHSFTFAEKEEANLHTLRHINRREVNFNAGIVR